METPLPLASSSRLHHKYFPSHTHPTPSPPPATSLMRPAAKWKHEALCSNAVRRSKRWLKRMLNQARYPVSHSLAPNPKLCLLQCTGVSSLTQKPPVPNNSYSGPCPVKLFRITDFHVKGHRQQTLHFAYPETRRLVEESATQS